MAATTTAYQPNKNKPVLLSGPLSQQPKTSTQAAAAGQTKPTQPTPPLGPQPPKTNQQPSQVVQAPQPPSSPAEPTADNVQPPASQQTQTTQTPRNDEETAAPRPVQDQQAQQDQQVQDPYGLDYNAASEEYANLGNQIEDLTSQAEVILSGIESEASSQGLIFDSNTGLLIDSGYQAKQAQQHADRALLLSEITPEQLKQHWPELKNRLLATGKLDDADFLEDIPGNSPDAFLKLMDAWVSGAGSSSEEIADLLQTMGIDPDSAGLGWLTAGEGLMSSSGLMIATKWMQDLFGEKDAWIPGGSIATDIDNFNTWREQESARLAYQDFQGLQNEYMGRFREARDLLGQVSDLEGKMADAEANMYLAGYRNEMGGLDQRMQDIIAQAAGDYGIILDENGNPMIDPNGISNQQIQRIFDAQRAEASAVQDQQADLARASMAAGGAKNGSLYSGANAMQQAYLEGDIFNQGAQTDRQMQIAQAGMEYEALQNYIQQVHGDRLNAIDIALQKAQQTYQWLFDNKQFDQAEQVRQQMAQMENDRYGIESQRNMQLQQLSWGHEQDMANMNFDFQRSMQPSVLDKVLSTSGQMIGQIGGMALGGYLGGPAMAAGAAATTAAKAAPTKK